MKTNLRNPLLIATLAALAASVAHAGTLWFDGGTADIATNGDGASAGLAGTWNTTLVNWDQGANLPHVVWDNSAAPGTVAAFGGPVGNGNRAVAVATVNAVDLVFSSGGTLGTGTRWTLSGGTITLGDTVDRKASFDASQMLAGSTVGVNVISTLAGNVSGGLTFIGTTYHGTSDAATPYTTYFNSLNPTRVNLLSISNTGTNTFTGPVTVTNALEIQGLSGSRYKALGPATNDITLSNGTLFIYNNNGILDQNIAVTGTINALNLNNNITSATISNSVTSGASDVLWSVAGTTNGRLTYTGDLSGFAGTLKVRGSASGATLIDTNTFGGTLEVESGALIVGNNTPRGTLGVNNVLNYGTIIFNRSDDYSYAGAISGTGVVTKQGPGTVTLAGANTYDGLTTVTAGRLAVAGSIAGDVSITGGSVAGTGSIAGTLTMGSGTAISAAGAAVTTGLTAEEVVFNGPTSLDFASAPVAATVYDVLNYGLTGVSWPEDFKSYVRGTLTHDTVARKFTFTAGGSKNLVWDGGSGDWDQIDTAKWNSGAEKFYDWDSVTFNDPGAAAIVSLYGTLRPAVIAVTNPAGNDYTFTGSGSIAGGTSLAKDGTGVLVLATTNSYGGGTTVNAGTLRLEHFSAAGLGPITLGDATLSLYRAGATTTYASPIISAAGTSGLLTVDGSGVDAGTGTNSIYTLGGIQVDGTLTITRPGGERGLTQYNGVLSGSGTLIVGDNNGGVDLIVDNTSNSRGRVFFANTNNTFNGHVRVLERGNFLNNTVSPSYQSLTIDAGAAITLVEPGSGGTTTVGRFNGEGIVARNTQSSQVVLAVGGANEDDSFSGIINAALFQGTGTIGFTKNGNATQTLSGADIRHTGTTTVNGGKLKLLDTSAWASAIVFGASGSPVLEFAGSASYTIATAITGGSASASLVKSSTGALGLNGNNTFTGSIDIQAGTLRAGHNQAFGANGTVITVADGAAVDTGGSLSAARSYHAIIQGTGVEGTGVITNSTVTDRSEGFAFVTLLDDATIGGNARWDVRAATPGTGQVNLGGHTLTKVGANRVALINSVISEGTIQVEGGRLGLTRCSWPVGTVAVGTGAMLDFENNGAGLFSYGMDIALADATQQTFGNDVTTNGGLSLAGACVVDVAADLKHTHTGVMSGTGTLAKTNSGAFVLGAANHTYSGTITIVAGSLLVNGTLSGGGHVTVETGATLGGSGSIAGHAVINENASVNPGNPGVGTLTLGSVTLSGAYRCEIDGASADRVDITGTLTIEAGASVVFTTLAAPTAAEYVIATYGGLTGGPPAIVNLPDGYDVDDSTPGVIKLVRTAAGYDAWADSWTEPPLADKAPGADPDNDGIPNLLEYVLGGDPRVANTNILPTQMIDGDFLVLSYQRSDASELDTTQTGQWSADLDTWHDIAPVLVNENGDGPDDMEIRIPLANAVNGMLYGRLKVGTGEL